MFNFKFLSKMTKSRFNLRTVATIVACLVVSMMFAACDKTNPDDDNGNGNGNGNGRELTAEEKKLVGQYSYNTTGSGDWAYFNSEYNYWKDSWGSFAEGIWFKPDGTFNGVIFAHGSAFINGGSLIKSTANWRISKTGIVTFSNMVQNVEYANGKKEIWRQSEHPGWDPEKKYEFKQRDGEEGIMYGDKEELFYKFYRKTE